MICNFIHAQPSTVPKKVSPTEFQPRRHFMCRMLDTSPHDNINKKLQIGDGENRNNNFLTSRSCVNIEVKIKYSIQQKEKKNDLSV